MAGTMGEGEEKNSRPHGRGRCGGYFGIIISNVVWVTFFIVYLREKAYVDLVPGLASKDALVYQPGNHPLSSRDPLSTVCEHFRNSMLPLEGSNRTKSNHPLIVMTGEGTTATRTAADALAGLGLQIGHWSACKGCTHETHVKWRALFKELRRSALGNVSHATLRKLEFLDGIGDQPVNNLIPDILDVFPRARILLTTRNATEWLRSRTEHHGEAPVPLLPAAIPYNKIGESPVELRNKGASDRAKRFLFGAQNVASTCLSRGHEFLHVDISTYHCNSALLWSRFAQFARVDRIPRASFPGCKPVWEHALGTVDKYAKRWNIG